MNSIRSRSSRKRRPYRAALVLIACAINAGVALTDRVFAGTLEIRLKDHREAIGDFSTLAIVIDAIRLSPKSGLKVWQMGWKELTPAVNKVDLTQYTGTRSAMIFKGEVNDGSFEGIHVKLKNVDGVAKKTKAPVSVKDFVGPIQLAFSMSPKQVTLIILDFVVLDVSDHPPAGYELRLKGYEVYTNGKLTAKVPPR